MLAFGLALRDQHQPHHHTISKRLVRTAQCTKRGLALEDLEGIRSRIKARRSQRRILHSWSFNQLRQFVASKATKAGVPVVFVDPRGTSRTCSECGHCHKRNRKTRDEFACGACGHEAPADLNGAKIIRLRAIVSLPMVVGDDAGRGKPAEPDYKPTASAVGR